MMKMNKETLFSAMTNVGDDLLAEYDALRPAEKVRRPRRKALLSAVIAAALALTMVVTVAASPAIRNFLNLPFTVESHRLTEVPEGSVGIYTAGDLEKIRDDMAGSYVLMANIDLGGAEWTPIGGSGDPFVGSFNGNGYVISNFTVHGSGKGRPAEEIARHTRTAAEGERYTDLYDSPMSLAPCANYIGFFGDAFCATIRNLGIKNAQIVVDDAFSCTVGVVAGQVAYISNCFAEDCTVTVHCADRYDTVTRDQTDDTLWKIGIDASRGLYSVSVGGLCGEAIVVDSCYTTGKIVLDGCDVRIPEDMYGSTYLNLSCFAGTVCGVPSSILTSWSDMTVEERVEGFRTGMCGIYRMYNAVMPGWAFDEIFDYIHPEQEHNRKRFLAMFMEYTMDIFEKYNIFDFPQLTEIYYDDVFDWDPDIKYKWVDDSCNRYELVFLSDLTEQCVPEDVLADIISRAHMKVGVRYCYTLTDDSYGQKDLEGFDFESVWYMKDGKPLQRIFADTTAK